MQSNEEMLMAQEDVSAKNIIKAEYVAQREELDQMYYNVKTVAGKEFQIFMKILDMKEE
jgi:hypothetical protein